MSIWQAGFTFITSNQLQFKRFDIEFYGDAVYMSKLCLVIIKALHVHVYYILVAEIKIRSTLQDYLLLIKRMCNKN